MSRARSDTSTAPLTPTIVGRFRRRGPLGGALDDALGQGARGPAERRAHGGDKGGKVVASTKSYGRVKY